MAPPPRHPRKPAPTSDRAAVQHLNHRHSPAAPTLASTRAAWLRESWSKPSTPVSAAEQASWQREEAAWQQRLAAAHASDRAAVQRPSNSQHVASVVPGTKHYYMVLLGHWDGVHLAVDAAYLLVRAHELADSVAAWYEASHLVAELSFKLDAGVQGRLEGMWGPVKLKGDINVVKADLFEVKADLTKPKSFAYKYAGKDGVTKISNSLTVAAEIPWLPKTPWGAVSLGGMVEQSQLIDGDLASTDYKQDYGLYLGVPLFKSNGMKSLGEKIKLNPATAMGKAPALNAKVGKPKDFYGGEVGLGAALLIGAEIKVKLGLAK